MVTLARNTDWLVGLILIAVPASIAFYIAWKKGRNK